MTAQLLARITVLEERLAATESERDALALALDQAQAQRSPTAGNAEELSRSPEAPGGEPGDPGPPEADLAIEAALRQRERQFATLVENSPDVIFRQRIAPQVGYEYLSPAVERLLGYPPARFLEDPFFLVGIVHPADRPIVERMNAELKVPTPFVLRLLHRDGQVVWVELNTTPVLDEAGATIAYEGVFHDISAHKQLEQANAALRQEIAERVRIEEALLANQRFTERVMAVFPAHVYIYDFRQKALIYVNRDLPTQLGYSALDRAKLGEYPIDQVMHPEDAAELPALYASYETLADDAVAENEFRARHYDGTWRWYATRDIVFTRDPIGAATQMLGVGIDITASKAVEAQLASTLRQMERLNLTLQHSSTLLQTIINSLDDALVLLDSDGRVLMANRAVALVCGHEPELIVGRLWSELCPFDSPLIMGALYEGRSVSGREQLTRNGAVCSFDIQAFPISSSELQRQLVLHIVDVTERLQFEELAIQNERLAATGRMAAVVAHEVNSPLQAIQNFLFLASSDDPAERDAHIAMISDEIDRIGGLIRRLLDLQRPDDASTRQIDMNMLIDRVLALTNSTMGRHRVKVLSELQTDLALVFGRSDHLTQVLLNLLLNAIDAMPHGGELRISSRQRSPVPGEELPHPLSGRVVELEVADTGSGIAENLLPRIFEPFYTTKTSGSGLGLAISSQIIEQHGGYIRAHNRSQGGAAFTVVLPAVEPELNQTLCASKLPPFPAGL